VPRHTRVGSVERGLQADESRAAQAIEERQTSVWPAVHLTRLVILDALSIWISLTTAALTRRGVSSLNVATSSGVSYALLVSATAGFWLLALSARGAYESRFYGTGPEEYKRVVSATFLTFGSVAIISYAFKLQLPRSFVAFSLPMGLGLLLIGRYAARRWLISRRSKGLSLHRVVAVGDDEAVDNLRSQLARRPFAGYDVVGSCPSNGDVKSALRASQGDTLAITASRDMTSHRLREISWGLEGTNVTLIVAPSLTDIAGPRIQVHPVEGLPLLYVAQPEFTGLRRVIKESFDRLLAGLIVLALWPLLAALALSIRLTGKGPVLFRQVRVGRGSKPFDCLKFRTMVVDADARLADLVAAEEESRLLFKLENDPRVTRIGSVLRRYSLDELPQLFNVLAGQMSLVGPRPQVQAEVALYTSDYRRRLLVKPGITGLWQVSGRSDLSYEDSERLDLYYVENWSITLDLLIMARTLSSVLRGSGAY
jgi:exopolysaccharide biosynthesis polyprenyl glycosylphosphotransferase